MVDVQAELNGNGKRRSPVSGFAGQAANVMGDLLELAELQSRLAKADAKLAAGRMIRPIALLLVGICGALASLPVLTMGLAGCLAAVTELSLWQAQLVVGLIVALAAVATIYLSVKAIRRSTLPFERSATQLTYNIAWLKSVLGNSRTFIEREQYE